MYRMTRLFFFFFNDAGLQQLSASAKKYSLQYDIEVIFKGHCNPALYSRFVLQL